MVRLAFLGFICGVVLSCLTVQAREFDSQRIIDMHVHTAGIGAGNSGCFMSPSLQNSYKFGFYLRAFGGSESELRNEGDAAGSGWGGFFAGTYTNADRDSTDRESGYNADMWAVTGGIDYSWSRFDR